MSRLSLRTRLVAVAVLLVAFAVTATGVATYLALDRYLSGQLDEQLQEVLSAPELPVCARDAVGRPGGPRRPFAAALIGPGGSVSQVDCGTSVRLAQPLELTGQDAARLLADRPDEPVTVRTTAGTFRATTVLTNQGLAAVGVSTADLEGTLGRLVGLELIAGAVAVAGTAMLGAAGVRLGLRPLDRVTRTARTVAAELGPDGRGLDRRVSEADPRTAVGQLGEAVNTRLDAVEREYRARYESEQRMRRFLADASHELRTPLTSLRGYAELVRLRGGLDETAGDSLRRIESEGTRMGRLVDDLLTLARADRGTVVERQPVDMAALVADCVAGLCAAYPDRTVSVRAGGPLQVLGDRDQLVQVVGNVLTNAAVHAEGTIMVTAARKDGEIVVQVADGGPGLPPEQAAQVFDRFWRADSARTRVRGGSGLGLSIVQVLVAEHGGRVSFDSDPAAGTTVTVRLPTAPAP